MKYFILSLAIVLTFIPQAVSAGGCYEDPELLRNWNGVVTTGARVRDGACMDGTTVLKTLPVGSIITIIGETDGWYHVVTKDGINGWVGQWLIKASEQTVARVVERVSAPISETSSALTSRLKGYILLQTESHGEAWYVNPTDSRRYYMKDGPTAYEMMRTFGLGITDSDLELLQAGNSSLVDRLKGRIVLQVQQHGEAYYVHPADGTVHYMRDGAAAYQIMRALSLGITNSDLDRVNSSELTIIPAASPTPGPEPVSTTNYGDISLSSSQVGSVPSRIDMIEVNTYWLSRINELRATAGLRLLELDQRFIDTASEYAAYMGQNEVFGHERADGSSMHEWIDQQGLEFTDRNSEGGWTGNYFTENISWGVMSNSMSSIEDVLEDTLNFYLSEASYNGAHYRTIYHEDWNSVGVGAYFGPESNGKYKVYFAFHYGSLK